MTCALIAIPVTSALLGLSVTSVLLLQEWFYENLYKDASKDPTLSEMIHVATNTEDILTVHRDNLFHSSCERVSKVSPDKLKSSFNVQFEGEEGVVSRFGLDLVGEGISHTNPCSVCKLLCDWID